MKKQVTYFLMVLMLFLACESIYIPDLGEVENVMVVDARLNAGNPVNTITLQKSQGFNDTGPFKPFTNALVQLIDDMGNGYITNQVEPGVFQLDVQLDPEFRYKLHIISGGETFESDFEEVPDIPDIDTIFGRHNEKWIQPGGEKDVASFRKIAGQQLLVDMDTENTKKYYRFSARKILQYYFPFDTVLFGAETVEYKYGWKSFYPTGEFNIAGPSEYSAEIDIVQHPVEFFRYDADALLDSTQRNAGWIYIMYQHGISETAYRFYKDLNSQLSADGKIFDPMYVQARSNLKCISKPGKIVLGNFEITSFREHRYFVKPDPNKGNHKIKKMNVFHDIPESGIIPLVIPWFWEN
jgi:hypothetical protein